MRIVVPLMLALFAAACAAPSATPGDPSGQPRSGGRLNVWVNPDPWDWDLSHNGKSEPGGEGQALGHTSLLGFKTGTESNGFADLILRPELAERWDVSSDAKQFTFHLRQGLKFPDVPPLNGRTLTSADAKWSFEYMSRTGAYSDTKKYGSGSFAWMFEGVQSIEAPDPATIKVSFKEPFVPFVRYAASDHNPIVAKEIFEQDGHLKDRILGAGPFVLDMAASQKGSRWIWKKNPNYYEQGQPYLDEVRWLVIGNDAAAHAAFQTKQVDLLQNRRTQDSGEIMKANPQAVNEEYLLPRGFHLYIGQKGVFKDKRLRQALGYAVDRDELIRTFAGGKGGWTPPGAMYGLFTETEARQMLKYDLAQAKRLVAEAGFPNGVTVEWNLSTDDSEANVSQITLLQAQLKKAGINVEMVTNEKTTQRLKRRNGDFDLDSSSGLGQLDSDIDSMLWVIYQSEDPGNYAKIKDPEVDRLLVAQRREVDSEKRRELLRTLVRYLNDQAWAVDLYYPPQWDFWHPYVKNYRPHFGSRAPYVFAWLDK